MANIGVFCIVMVFSFTIPGEVIVREAVRGTIITDGKNSVVGADDAGTNLGAGIFAT